MKHRFLAALGLVTAAALPTTASANRVRDVSLSAAGDDVVIAITAEESLGQPRLRSTRGDVKMWIPEINEDARLDIEGDGRAITRLRLRPGAADSALLQVQLKSGKRLPTSALRVEVLGEKAILRLPKRLLPEWSVAESPEPVEAVQSATQTPATKAPEVATAAVLEQSVSAATAGPEAVATKPASTKLPTLATLASAKGPLEQSTSTGGGLPYALIFLSVAGLSAVALLKKMQQRRGGLGGDLTDIQVLGVRRLGPRHQLILVRALGEDHLLSMNGDRTERIASMPSSDSTLSLPLSPKALPAMATPEDQYRDLIAAASQRTDRVSVERESPPVERDRIPGTPFGGELLNFMNRRIPQTSRPPERPESPSVEGLLRLRREAS